MEQGKQAGVRAGAKVTNKIDEAKNLAREVAEKAQFQGREKLESGKQTAADQTDKLADVVERAAQELGNGEQQSLAEYAGQLATSMRTLAENLRGKSIDELFRDTQELARRNPTVFFFGSVAAGVALSRFLKASGERNSANNKADTYHVTSRPPVEPAGFEGDAGVSWATATPVSSIPDSPSFADDSKKGI